MEIRVLIAVCQSSETLREISNLELIQSLAESDNDHFSCNGWDIDVYKKSVFESLFNEQDDFIKDECIRIVVYQAEKRYTYTEI